MCVGLRGSLVGHEEEGCRTDGRASNHADDCAVHVTNDRTRCRRISYALSCAPRPLFTFQRRVVRLNSLSPECAALGGLPAANTFFSKLLAERRRSDSARRRQRGGDDNKLQETSRRRRRQPLR